MHCWGAVVVQAGRAVSYPGWRALRAIEDEERKEFRRRKRYVGRFTPEERDYIAAFGSRVYRDQEPKIRPGWVRVRPSLEAHVASVRPHKGRWIIVIDRMRDFRAPSADGQPPPRTKRPLEAVTTLHGADGKHEGEPGRVDREYERELTMEARRRWAEHQTQERAAEMARRDAKRLYEGLKRLVAEVTTAGGDATPIIARMTRELESQEEQWREAA